MLTKKGASKSPSSTKTAKPSKPGATAANRTKSVANATVETLLKSSLNQPTAKNLSKIAPVSKKNSVKTKIIIKYNAGFPNQLFIRGEGASLSWDKGQKLVNVKADEWTWETTQNFSQCQFKILLNDQVYEKGENHLLNEGALIQYTPSF